MNGEEPRPPADAAVTRRHVLASAIGVLSGLIALVLGLPSVVTLVGRRAPKSKAGRFMKVAALAALPDGQPVNLKYSEMVEKAYIRAPEMRDIWALKTADSKVTVYSPICPHLGCRYGWNAEAREFMCPCHGSVWTADGKVVAGPAPRPLDTLPTKIIDGDLYVEWELFEVGTRAKIVM